MWFKWGRKPSPPLNGIQLLHNECHRYNLQAVKLTLFWCTMLWVLSNAHIYTPKSSLVPFNKPVLSPNSNLWRLLACKWNHTVCSCLNLVYSLSIMLLRVVYIVEYISMSSVVDFFLLPLYKYITIYSFIQEFSMLRFWRKKIRKQNRVCNIFLI